MIDKEFDVFLSYHGGKGDDSRSSYAMAEKLYGYLRQHGLNPFLYKKEGASNFYQAINDAILKCRHFILIACDKEMLLSEWVTNEVAQFDSLRRNGKKPNCLFSACIFGNLTEDDLFRFNPVYATIDIAHGEQEFEKLYNAIKIEENKRDVVADVVASVNIEPKTFDDVTKTFISSYIESYTNNDNNVYSKEAYDRNCEIITKRLKCMSTVTISSSCENVIDEYYNRILKLDKSASYNLMQVSGQAGTQKSYVLQLLYLRFRMNMSDHNFDPVYVNCDDIRNKLMNGEQSDYLDKLFASVKQEEGRDALFIIDGIRNIVADNFRVDFLLKKISDSYGNAYYIVGKNSIHCDNPIRANKSLLAKNRYEIMLNLSPISLYDKEKCLEYISTIKNLPIEDPSEIYRILYKSGLLNVNEYIIRTICENYDGNTVPKIMSVFADELLNRLDGDEDLLQRDANIIFEFAYSNDQMTFEDKNTLAILDLICKEQIFLSCLIALFYTYKLNEYDKTDDYSFFQMVFPKEITRFIIQRVNEYSKYEDSIISLAKHYYEMNDYGKSEMSFLLGRIKSTNQRTKAIELLHEYYNKANEDLKKKLINHEHNNIPYSHKEHKQDLFLIRGLSVSLIYCGDQKVLYSYIKSLINDDLSNSINRGFHLEYYGDIRYMPNQPTLNYEDNPKLGERTLRILCNSVYNQLKSGELHPAVLLELFTITSLLQVRIETPKKLISFNLHEFIVRCLELIPPCLEAIKCEDNVVESFFNMAIKDFEAYLHSKQTYSPQCGLCNDYLAAYNVKRTGWVMQNIPQPESIVEHMYSCWFIGLVCLPNSDEDMPDYNKQEILNMLLIHDLAETKLNDIPKYEKVNYPDYNRLENLEMLALLLKGTYGSMDVLTPYVNAWDEWYKYDSINAKIAKDIDVIQAIYQFLVYNNIYPHCFSRERKLGWLNEMQCITTKQGHKILNEIIIQNPIFRNTLEEYGYYPQD